MNSNDYWIISNEFTIIFKPKFNKLIYFNEKIIIQKIIFSNYYDYNKSINTYDNENLPIYKPYIEISSKKKNLFNCTVDNLPQKLKYLIFGYSFNNLVDNLPLELEYLSFDDNFNQCVNNLPQNIIKIVFGKLFDQLLNDLPYRIEHIVLGCNYQKELISLPPNLKNIICCVEYVYNSKLSDYDLELYPRPISNIKLNFNHPIKQFVWI